jgi:hypothetical protein
VGGRDIGRGFGAAPRGRGAVVEAVVGRLGGREGGCVGDSRGRGPR